MNQVLTDIEVQYNELNEDIKLIEELLQNLPNIKHRLNKLKQRRNQMQLLVDIHKGKLYVHRADNGNRIPVQFGA